MTVVPQARPPLGLPAGTIRGILALQIAAVFWVLLLVSDERIKIPLNLYLMLSLVMIFFVTHGHGRGAPATGPDGKPMGNSLISVGMIRLIIFLGTIGVITYVSIQHPDRLQNRLTPDPDIIREAWKYYFGALSIGFSAGLIVRFMPFKNSWLYQSFQAWTAIIAMAILFLDMVFQVFINITLPRPVDEALPWGTALTGIVSFYYGSRS